MPDERLSDDEVVLRRIPPGTQWFEPPDRISSFNFKLKPNEEGLSVYRTKVVSAEEVLAKPEVIQGSLIAWATVGEIRTLRNAKGEELQLDVIATADADNPGHAEIRGTESKKILASASKALRRLFQLYPDREQS